MIITLALLIIDFPKIRVENEKTPLDVIEVD